MEHAGRLDHPFPWRTAAVAAAIVALAELVALLAVAGVRLAPGLRHAKGPAAAQTVAPVTSPARAAAPTHTTPAPTRAAGPLRPRSRASVLVLNGNGVTGAAGREAQMLLARGYRGATPTGAANHDYARSIVLYAPGWEREGKRLGRDAGVRIVGPLDGLKPSQLRGSQLVVILGGS